MPQLTKKQKPLLAVRGLKTGYANRAVVHGVDLTVQPGEIVALIGFNGAGKSTLLKAIAGLLPVWQGTVRFRGEDITNEPAHEVVRHGLQFIGPNERIFPTLSVAENLAMSSRLIGDRIERVRHEAQTFERFPLLKKHRHDRAELLSGGEQQALAFARVLMTEPEMLLLDEPSLGLSPKLITESSQRLETLRRELNLTVLIVEQAVRHALDIADHVYVLSHGQVTFSGPTAQAQKNLHHLLFARG